MASTVTTGAPARQHLTQALALAAIVAMGVTFVAMFVFPYYLNYNQQGLHRYWPVRLWLLLHISCGMVALLTGPVQFSTRLRQRYLKFHRILGRVYLIAVALGSVGAIGLSLSGVTAWSFSFSLFCMAIAWSTCGAMAYYAVRQRQIQVHKEWMVRTYILTFGFVTFRMLNTVAPTSHLQPRLERADVFVWACWVMPLIGAEVIMQLMKMRKPARVAS